MTLQEAQALAETHWDDRPGHRCMGVFVRRCVETLGAARTVDSLGIADGVALLASLRASGLSPKTVAAYYAAFRRMLRLNGVETVGWPKAPTPPRKTREAMSHDDV